MMPLSTRPTSSYLKERCGYQLICVFMWDQKKNNGLKHHQYVTNMRKELQDVYQSAVDAILASQENTNYMTDGTRYLVW